MINNFYILLGIMIGYVENNNNNSQPQQNNGLQSQNAVNHAEVPIRRQNATLFNNAIPLLRHNFPPAPPVQSVRPTRVSNAEVFRDLLQRLSSGNDDFDGEENEIFHANMEANEEFRQWCITWLKRRIENKTFVVRRTMNRNHEFTSSLRADIFRAIARDYRSDSHISNLDLGDN